MKDTLQSDLTNIGIVSALQGGIERHIRYRRNSLGSYYKPELDPDLRIMVGRYKIALASLVRNAE